jgi:hypothetical protein
VFPDKVAGRQVCQEARMDFDWKITDPPPPVLIDRLNSNSDSEKLNLSAKTNLDTQPLSKSDTDLKTSSGVSAEKVARSQTLEKALNGAGFNTPWIGGLFLSGILMGALHYV